MPAPKGDHAQTRAGGFFATAGAEVNQPATAPGARPPPPPPPPPPRLSGRRDALVLEEAPASHHQHADVVPLLTRPTHAAMAADRDRVVGRVHRPASRPARSCPCHHRRPVIPFSHGRRWQPCETITLVRLAVLLIALALAPTLACGDNTAAPPVDIGAAGDVRALVYPDPAQIELLRGDEVVWSTRAGGGLSDDGAPHGFAGVRTATADIQMLYGSFKFEPDAGDPWRGIDALGDITATGATATFTLLAVGGEREGAGAD